MVRVGLTLLLAAVAHAEEIRFDFGSVQIMAPKPWNGVLRWRHPGPVVTDALDTTRRRTTVCLQLLDPWAGVSTSGNRAGRRWPAAATADSFYLARGVDERARIRLDGLVPGAAYRLVLGASRQSRRRLDCEARYRIGAETRKLDAANNASAVAKFDSVKADAEGKIEIAITIAPGHAVAHLGTLILEGRFRAAAQRKAAPGPPGVTAWAWVIADAKTGTILWERNGDVPLPPGSTSKIMTGYVILHRARRDPGFLEQQATISRFADSIIGTSAWIRRGWQVSVDDLMYGMLLPSGNDAATALGEHCSGSVLKFAKDMNGAARRLKLPHSHFVHPHGLDGRGQFQSARDLMRVSHAFLELGGDRYVGTRKHRAQVTDGNGRVRVVNYVNTNKLLKEPGYDGVKTGWTPSGQGCIVVRARRGDAALLVALMKSAGAASRFSDARKLCDWAFARR